VGTKGYDIISDGTTRGPWQGYLNLNSNPSLNCSKRNVHEEMLIQHWEMVQTSYLDCQSSSGAVCKYRLDGVMCVLIPANSGPPSYRNLCLYSPQSYPATQYRSDKVYGAIERITRDWTETKCVAFLSGYYIHKDPLQYLTHDGDDLRAARNLTEVEVDGKRLPSHTRTVTLSSGPHIVTGSYKKSGKPVKLTATVTVEPRIDFEVEKPVLNCPRKHGTRLAFSVELKNNMSFKRFVKFEVSSQPLGWQAYVVGKPFGMVGARQSISVKFEAIQLKSFGKKSKDRKLVPVSILAKSGKHMAECSVYVRAI
jgi:hypothetical protein